MTNDLRRDNVTMPVMIEPLRDFGLPFPMSHTCRVRTGVRVPLSPHLGVVGINEMGADWAMWRLGGTGEMRTPSQSIDGQRHGHHRGTLRA